MTLFELLAIIPGLFIGLFLWLCFNWLLSFKSKKIPKIYTQPGFWYPLKYVLIRIMLWQRKRYNEQQQQKKAASSGNAGYGVKSRNSPEEMDQLQELPESKPLVLVGSLLLVEFSVRQSMIYFHDTGLAVDAVYFNAGNADGVFFVAATARRQENVVQTLLYVKIPSIGLLELPSLPDTWLTDKNSDKAYTASGLVLTPLKPMDTWSLSYDGPLRLAGTNKTVAVKFDLLWTAKAKYFDFDTDLHPHTMADAIAREKWSREFFDTLKSAHQTHYEQFGEITGVVHVEGYPDQDMKVQGIRDHSYGNVRDWKYFHRYAINYAFLEDGTGLCIGAIAMSMLMSRFVIGYVFKPDGSMSPVSSSDFEFYDWGDDGTTPDELVINFVAGKEKYHLVCNKIQSPIFYMGKEWDAKIHERFCNYTVNGLKGWGISEWDYRNYDGKELEMKRLEKM